MYCSDYVVQAAPFIVYGDSGCGSAQVGAGLTVLLVGSWQVVLALISAAVYCREPLHCVTKRLDLTITS